MWTQERGFLTSTASLEDYTEGSRRSRQGSFFCLKGDIGIERDVTGWCSVAAQRLRERGSGGQSIAEFLCGFLRANSSWLPCHLL